MATLFNTKIKDTYQSLLKLEDNTILTTTTKNVTDGLGNASPLYMSTTRVGIGTNAPSVAFEVRSLNQTDVIRFKSQYAQYGYLWTGNTQIGLGSSSFGDGTGTHIVLNNIGAWIGAAGADMATAKLQVKGSGSTSATTSFLVQNSSGTAALTVRDDLYVFGGSRVYSTGNMYMDGNSGTLFSAWGQLQLQGASYVQIMNDTLRVGSQNFNFINTSFSPNNSTNSNLILNGNGSSFTNAGAGSTSVGNVLSIPIGLSTSTGNVTLNHINIDGVINTTAGTTLQRGFYYNPTLTGTVGFTHRAIETVTGNVLLGTTSGNVGIGTSSPTNKLEVVGTGRISSTLNVGGDGSTSTSFASGFIAYDTGNAYGHSLVHAQSAQLYLFANPQGFAAGGYEPSSGGLSSGNLAFMTASTTRLKILNNGNVLIGTTTDSGHKLRVNGSIVGSSVIVGDPVSPQGTVTAGQIDLNYPNFFRYQSLYYFTIQPKDNSGNNVNTGGYVAIKADTIQLLHDSYFLLSIATLNNGSDTVKLKRTTNFGHLQCYLSIEGSDAAAGYNYGTRSGSVLIYPGEQSFGNGYGNVILAHSGTAARGNVGVGEASPTARLQVKGSGNSSATTSLLVQNSGGTEAFRIYDDRTAYFSSQVQIQSTIFADSGQIFRNSGNLALQSVAGVGNNKSVVINASPNITEADVAILVCNSTTKGFLPPRMTNAQRAAITSPAIGLMVYCTDAVEGIYVYKSTGWTFVA